MSCLDSMSYIVHLYADYPWRLCLNHLMRYWLPVQCNLNYYFSMMYCDALIACLTSLSVETIGKAGSIAVLPRRYSPLGPGLIHSHGTIFWFPVYTCFLRFFRVHQFSLLHPKLDSLNKSVSGKKYLV